MNIVYIHNIEHFRIYSSLLHLPMIDLKYYYMYLLVYLLQKNSNLQCILTSLFLFRWCIHRCLHLLHRRAKVVYLYIQAECKYTEQWLARKRRLFLGVQIICLRYKRTFYLKLNKILCVFSNILLTYQNSFHHFSSYVLFHNSVL